MSNYIKLSVFTASYNNEDAAKEDYEAVKALYYGLGVMDTFDAAVIEKNAKGKVTIIKKHEQPTRQAGWAGASLGLAAGLTVALFPAVALTGGLMAGAAATGAAMGAVIGHVAGGMSRGDLKELGQVLDEGEYGLLVVAATDVGARVQETITSAAKVVKKELKADKKNLDKEITEALKS